MKYHLFQCIIRDDILFYKKIALDNTCILWVSMVFKLIQILELFHASHIAGHFAIQITLKSL